VFQGLLHYGNPALAQFNRSVAVQLSGESCHYNPFVKARNDCERNQEWLTKQGVIYQLDESSKAPVQVTVQHQVPVAAFQPDELKRTLQAAGWPIRPNPDKSTATR